MILRPLRIFTGKFFGKGIERKRGSIEEGEKEKLGNASSSGAFSKVNEVLYL